MRRLVVVLVLAILFAPVCFAQGGPEADSLIDAIYAKDVNGILAHLPPEFEKLYDEFSPADKAQFARILPVANLLLGEGIKITRGYGSGPVLVLEPVKPGQGLEGPVEIYIDKRLTDGTETLLRLRFEGIESGNHETKTATLNLRYVDGDWRLYEFQAEGRVLKLDDPMFLAGFHRSRGAAQEASAVGIMRTLNTALVVYTTTYPEIGYAQSIEQLGTGASCEQASADHACLIDKTLATPPFEKDGYRYTYRRLSNDAYTITARPITYSNETTRSFFTDQSGVIRVTTDDREPTAEDAPLR